MSSEFHFQLLTIPQCCATKNFKVRICLAPGLATELCPRAPPSSEEKAKPNLKRILHLTFRTKQFFKKSSFDEIFPSPNLLWGVIHVEKSWVYYPQGKSLTRLSHIIPSLPLAAAPKSSVVSSLEGKPRAVLPANSESMPFVISDHPKIPRDSFQRWWEIQFC